MTENNGADGNAKTDSANEDHHALYQLVFVIFGGLVTSIVEFALLWTENHYLAFLAMASSLSLISIYQTRIWGWDINWIIAGVFFWFAGAQILNGIIGPIQIQDTEVIGELQPGNDPTPTNPCDNPVRKRNEPTPPTLKILIGTNALAVTQTGRFKVLSIGSCPIISMHWAQDRIAVDADLYAESGLLAFEQPRFPAVEQLHGLPGADD
jgi:hypothetical protein